MMLRGDLETFEYLSENETRNENILTHWTVAQAGSSDEKIMRVESLVGLSLQSHKSLKQLANKNENFSRKTHKM